MAQPARPGVSVDDLSGSSRAGERPGCRPGAAIPRPYGCHSAGCARGSLAQLKRMSCEGRLTGSPPMKAVSAIWTAGSGRGSVWSPLIALAFVLAAALSFAVDQVVALSVDLEP